MREGSGLVVRLALFVNVPGAGEEVPTVSWSALMVAVTMDAKAVVARLSIFCLVRCLV
jgi:hypothetical protein